MTQPNKSTARHSNAYNLFILVMTVFSLVIMVMTHTHHIDKGQEHVIKIP